MLNRVLTLAALSVAASTLSFAQTTATTDPVGFTSYTFNTGTQYCGVSLVNTPVFSGSAASITGFVVTASGSGLNFSTVVTAGKTYYLEVRKDTAGAGALEGDRFDVDTAATIASANGTITLKSTLENTIAGTPPAALAGTNFVIREHVTLGQLLTAMPAAFQTGDQLFMRKDGGSVVAFTYNGTQWRQGLTNANPTIVYPGVGFALVRAAGSATAGTVLGGVRVNNFVQIIRSGEQIISEGFPVECAPNPTDGVTPTRLFTNDQGTTFANGDRLYAHHPTTGAVTAYTYATATNRWAAGLTNGNGLKLFQTTRGIYLISAVSNPAYLHVRPFTP